MECKKDKTIITFLNILVLYMVTIVINDSGQFNVLDCRV